MTPDLLWDKATSGPEVIAGKGKLHRQKTGIRPACLVPKQRKTLIFFLQKDLRERGRE